MTKYIFNHFYKIRHDIKRSHIWAPDNVNRDHSSFIHCGWISIIHPQLAMILSFFSEPKSLGELENDISYFLDVSQKQAKFLISLLINNPDDFGIEYQGFKFFLPKNLIIAESEQFVHPVTYTPSMFAYCELDFEQIRFYSAPITAVFMVNNICVTDCIYCYANKQHKAQPLEYRRLEEVIKEAHKLGLKQISLDGGEVFLYKYWKELLALLYKYELNDNFISTKMPLNETDILELKKYDITLQVSLDSINPAILQRTLNVNKNYTEKIKNSIYLLNKNGIKFQIATVLTRFNGNVTCLEELHEFLNQFENLHTWSIRLAFKSLYSKENFDSIKLDKKNIQFLELWLNDLKQKSSLNIKCELQVENKYFKGTEGSRSFKGARCSANYSNIFILPDGKVTICEQLYWKPNYIIGDLNKQSIKEIWNSSKALKLAFPKKENFSPKSVCASCKIFDECMSFPNRCITDILKAYGEENADYPDPRCCKAPSFINNILNE